MKFLHPKRGNERWLVRVHKGIILPSYMGINDGFWEWKFPEMLDDKKWWLEPGCVHNHDGPLPTFTRALPRKTPPKQAAGLATASKQKPLKDGG